MAELMGMACAHGIDLGSNCFDCTQAFRERKHEGPALPVQPVRYPDPDYGYYCFYPPAEVDIRRSIAIRHDGQRGGVDTIHFHVRGESCNERCEVVSSR